MQYDNAEETLTLNWQLIILTRKDTHLCSLCGRQKQYAFEVDAALGRLDVAQTSLCVLA